MDTLSLEREGNAIGNALFQQIIADLKNTSPLWEDFITKANKLYACLRTAIQAIAAYLDAFQKIADAATNSKGASKEIGTALTRVCLRQKSVETRLKTFASAIMDCLILPLQDKVEDWKRQVVQLDKDHAKEYKRCRVELKKRSQDTLRLQKKARKSSSQAMMGANTLNTDKSIKSMMESSMMDVTQRRSELEDVERKSLRAAMLEERQRYCAFVNLLQPVVKEEYEVMYELGHLQEAMQTVTDVTREPNVLPAASEELILEIKTPMNYLYPDSPSHTAGSGGGLNGNNNGCGMSTSSNSQGCSNSLGSRKSSVCSISSMNSSGSGGPMAGNGNLAGISATGSPGHQQQQFQRSISQLISPVMRLKPGESSDSGFCSSPALTAQTSSGSGTIPTHAVSTWPPHAEDDMGTSAGIGQADRPHTISSAYEKGHQRPALTVYTFQNPEVMGSTGTAASAGPVTAAPTSAADMAQRGSSSSIASRPPIPVRCSSLERPQGTAPGSKTSMVNAARQCPSPLPQHITKEHPQLQPTYVNMSELATMAAMKMQSPANAPMLPPLLSANSQQPQQLQSPVLSTASSLTNDSSAATHHPSSPDVSSAATTSTAATPVNSAPETNHNSPTTPVVSHEYDSGFSMDSKTISPENDMKSVGSVIEKASLFERLEQKQLHHKSSTPSSSMSTTPTGMSPMNRSESMCGRRNEEIYRACGTLDTDKIAEDSIQELNNLIGELDLFQKEHELSTLLAKCQPNRAPQPSAVVAEFPTPSAHVHSSTDDVDAAAPVNAAKATTPYEGRPLIGGGAWPSPSRTANGGNNNGSLNGSFDEETASSSSGIHNGFENPSFRYLHSDAELLEHGMTGGQEIILIQDDELSGNTQKYLQDNSEIVTLRCKDTQRQSAATENNYASIGLGGIGNDNLIVNGGGKGAGGNHGGADAKGGQQQRLSSFKNDAVQQQRTSLGVPQSPPSGMPLKRTHSQNYANDKPSSMAAATGSNGTTVGVEQGQQSVVYMGNGQGAGELTVMEPPMTQVVLVSPDGKLRNKPIVSPRPTSLSGGTRLARRLSVNSTKPPPPVRRSSSVTPSPHQLMGSPLNLSQQNLTASSESLPPPPAYLLDTAGQGSQNAAGNVAGTIKALTELRHMPASPGVLRRAQILLQNQQQQQQQQAQGNNVQNPMQSPPHSSASLIYNNYDNQHRYNKQEPQPPYHQNGAASSSMLYANTNFVTAAAAAGHSSEMTTLVQQHGSDPSRVLVYNQHYDERYVISSSCSNNLNSALSVSQSSLPPPPDDRDLYYASNVAAAVPPNNIHLLHYPQSSSSVYQSYEPSARKPLSFNGVVSGSGRGGESATDPREDLETNYRTAPPTSSSSPGQGAYANPKNSKMLSFRNQSPGSGKGQSAAPGSTSLIAQLSARLTPSKQQQLHNERFNEAKMYAQQLQQGQGVYEQAAAVLAAGHHQQHRQNVAPGGGGGAEPIYGKQSEYYAPRLLGPPGGGGVGPSQLSQPHPHPPQLPLTSPPGACKGAAGPVDKTKIYYAPQQPSSSSNVNVPGRYQTPPQPIPSSGHVPSSHYSINQKIYMSPTNPFLSNPLSPPQSPPVHHQSHYGVSGMPTNTAGGGNGSQMSSPRHQPPAVPQRSYLQQYHASAKAMQQQQQQANVMEATNMSGHMGSLPATYSANPQAHHPPQYLYQRPQPPGTKFTTSPIYNNANPGPSTPMNHNIAHHPKGSESATGGAPAQQRLSKTTVGFVENLNAKLAEQRLSGKAYAVRSLINSKALNPQDHFNIVRDLEPDPRACHESLMDQIKRGATLRRNGTINDRSAPKIH